LVRQLARVDKVYSEAVSQRAQRDMRGVGGGACQRHCDGQAVITEVRRAEGEGSRGAIEVIACSVGSA